MHRPPLIIGISGATASGKSLLANTIVKELDSSRVDIISEDSYYLDQSHLSLEERTKTNYDHPSSMEHDLLVRHLQQLQRGETIEVPTYDHAHHTRAAETRTVGQHAILVLEGILLFTNPALREMMDVRIFMDTPLDICLIRRLRRDLVERGRTIESVLDQYTQTVRPMYLQFVEPSKQFADIIVPRGGENRIAIDMIKAKMQELLQTL